MERILIEIGLSWTWSKLFPYLICVLLGIGLYRLVRKRFNQKLFRRLSLLFIAVPFSIYFIVHPIYEGDFSNQSEGHKYEQYTVKPNRLTVLAIPGCPYCYAAIDDLILIKKRTNCDTIDFIVFTEDEETLEWYRDRANGALNIIAVSDEHYTSGLSNGTFPAFVYGDNQTLNVWSNDNFGVLAKDHIEDQLIGKSQS